MYFRLGFTMSYNKSDSSTGWNAFLNGFTVYYPHYLDDVVEEVRLFVYLVLNLTLIQSHSIILTPKLTPFVLFQHVQKTFMGKN